MFLLLFVIMLYFFNVSFVTVKINNFPTDFPSYRAKLFYFIILDLIKKNSIFFIYIELIELCLLFFCLNTSHIVRITSI